MQLTVENLSKVFPSVSGDPKVVLSKISFSVGAGEILTLRGPNGCGKTTLANLIAQLDTPSVGTIRSNPPHLLVEPVGFVFQDYGGSLLPWLRVRDNIILPHLVRGIDRHQALNGLDDLLSSSPLFDLDVTAYPQHLSGGQQQRVAIARALFSRSPLLVFDEPFSSLDTKSKRELIAIFHSLRRRELLIVLISHDLEDTLLLSDRVLCLGDSPTSVIAEVPVELPWPREASFRLDSRFLAARERILKAFSLNQRLA